jgi:signal transduction histidine kinase
MLATIAEKYQQLIDYFVPHTLRGDKETANQARMFLISHTMGPILGNSVPLALYFFDPTPRWDILAIAISITGFWVFPFLLKRGFGYDRLVITSVINLNFCIFLSCYHNGGIASPTLPWVLLIPILSFFYIGGEQRLQSRLLGIFGGAFLTFVTTYFLFRPEPNDIPETALLALGIVSTTAALCYVATMAIYYARIFDAGVKLEGEVRRRREATDELREAVADADRVGQMKAEFLARMSHELRTPLNAVIGYSQILKEDAVDTQNKQMESDIDRIHDAGQYLLRLINMILDLSKIEAGRMQFDVKPSRIDTILANNVSLAQSAMDASGNTLDVLMQTSALDIETDSARISQIVDAILQNAATHTKNGKVTVSCANSIDRTGRRFLEIKIRDTGVGISQERLKTLFETLFDTLDASTSKYGGTGLNLTVTQKLCQAMGGRITVESTLGQGSCFTVTLPVIWHDEQLTVQSAAIAAAA